MITTALFKRGPVRLLRGDVVTCPAALKPRRPARACCSLKVFVDSGPWSASPRRCEEAVCRR